MLGKALLSNKIDLDLVCLGFLAIIIRSIDMYFTYTNIRVHGHEELTLGLKKLFEALGLERGIIVSQVISAIIVFVIVYFSQIARGRHLKIQFTLHILLINHIIGLVLTINGLMNSMIHFWITALTFIAIFMITSLDLKELLK
ncbi:MAG: hypothetical protein DRO23_08700 [Thermoprotei archaeon]|nr:MAG: hypothetical protein DRO23_08700 [Thermoprotei archaeon]